MNVLFVTHSGSFYGANRSLLGLIEGLRPHGVKTHVLYPSGGEISAVLGSRDFPFLGLPFHRWRTPHRSLIGGLKRFAANLRLLSDVIRLARVWKIDVIYSNSSMNRTVFCTGGVADNWKSL